MSWGHTRRWSCRNPFSWLWSQGWQRPLETQIGNTHSHSRKGVPIGVDEPTLTSPECGPRRKNSEEVQMIEKTCLHLQVATTMIQLKPSQTPSKRHLWKKKAMGLVEGPFTKQEAANRCGCNPSELCPGPMAVIDEGDKIRTIYDGSFGGANAHIQQNSTEKTTAPTVMDCVHGIHWLRAAREVSTSESAPQGQRATADGVDPMSKGSVWHWPNKDSTFLLLKADVSKGP